MSCSSGAALTQLPNSPKSFLCSAFLLQRHQLRGEDLWPNISQGSWRRANQSSPVRQTWQVLTCCKVLVQGEHAKSPRNPTWNLSAVRHQSRSSFHCFLVCYKLMQRKLLATIYSTFCANWSTSDTVLPCLPSAATHFTNSWVHFSALDFATLQNFLHPSNWIVDFFLNFIFKQIKLFWKTLFFFTEALGGRRDSVAAWQQNRVKGNKKHHAIKPLTPNNISGSNRSRLLIKN